MKTDSRKSQKAWYVDTIKECLWCGKSFKTKLLRGYQPMKTSCCEEHKRLAEEKRIRDIGSTDPEDEQRIA